MFSDKYRLRIPTLPALVLLALLLMPILLASVHGEDAQPNPFQVTTDLPPAAILPVGTDITVKAELTYPETYSFCGSSIYAYLFNLPGNFCAITGKTASVPKDPKWASVRLEPMVWTQAAARRSRSHERTFSTQGWPAGDYSLVLSCFLQPLARDQNLPDKYVTARLLFTLE
ncbi:MAG TPA: hypothetical protein PKY10_08970 [Lentisphaeria bacterium]|nr:hypothetical protein [Lentisphaeria bacterium]